MWSFSCHVPWRSSTSPGDGFRFAGSNVGEKTLAPEYGSDDPTSWKKSVPLLLPSPVSSNVSVHKYDAPVTSIGAPLAGCPWSVGSATSRMRLPLPSGFGVMFVLG